MTKTLTFILIPLLLASCASSPLDRSQVVLYSESEMAQQGERSYRQMQQEIPTSQDEREIRYVQCVSDHIIAALDDSQRAQGDWEVTVFDQDQANAFALPGGKIGVYNGLFDTAVNQHQLAAVIAHEVGHVLANHSNERASQATIRSVGVATAQILGVSNATLELIDLGAQYGLFLPFNRTQESEADAIGILLMANAGFDPNQSVLLWENMSVDAGPRSPELLSTHPSPDSRIRELKSRMPQANALMLSASGRGLNPDCIR
jgi:predicted Zn-dependent protease